MHYEKVKERKTKAEAVTDSVAMEAKILQEEQKLQFTKQREMQW